MHLLGLESSFRRPSSWCYFAIPCFPGNEGYNTPASVRGMESVVSKLGPRDPAKTPGDGDGEGAGWRVPGPHRPGWVEPTLASLGISPRNGKRRHSHWRINLQRRNVRCAHASGSSKQSNRGDEPLCDRRDGQAHRAAMFLDMPLIQTYSVQLLFINPATSYPHARRGDLGLRAPQNKRGNRHLPSPRRCHDLQRIVSRVGYRTD